MPQLYSSVDNSPSGRHKRCLCNDANIKSFLKKLLIPSIGACVTNFRLHLDSVSLCQQPKRILKVITVTNLACSCEETDKFLGFALKNLPNLLRLQINCNLHPPEPAEAYSIGRHGYLSEISALDIREVELVCCCFGGRLFPKLITSPCYTNVTALLLSSTFNYRIRHGDLSLTIPVHEPRFFTKAANFLS